MRYKGYELLKAIVNGEIKEGSRFRIDGYKQIIEYNSGILYYIDDNFDEVSSSVIINCIFELIEDETIDIDNIEELDKCKFGYGNTISYQESKFIDKVNELVLAVKQLNKEIKSIKEK
jgi:hypothetical protein